MRQLYEATWEAAPQDPEPWEWERRSRLLRDALPPGGPWLDLGCGAGRFLTLAPGGIGVEIAQAAVDRARRQHPDVRLWEAGEPLPVDDASVGFVWCSEVIEHVPDLPPFLSEIRRVMAPGGELLVTTPDHPLLRRTAIAVAAFDRHFDPLGQHVRFFTCRSLARVLDDFDFEDLRMRRRALRATIVCHARKPGRARSL